MSEASKTRQRSTSHFKSRVNLHYAVLAAPTFFLSNTTMIQSHIFFFFLTLTLSFSQRIRITLHECNNDPYQFSRPLALFYKLKPSCITASKQKLQPRTEKQHLKCNVIEGSTCCWWPPPSYSVSHNAQRQYRIVVRAAHQQPFDRQPCTSYSV